MKIQVISIMVNAFYFCQFGKSQCLLSMTTGTLGILSGWGRVGDNGEVIISPFMGCPSPVYSLYFNGGWQLICNCMFALIVVSRNVVRSTKEWSKREGLQRECKKWQGQEQKQDKHWWENTSVKQSEHLGGNLLHIVVSLRSFRVFKSILSKCEKLISE